MSDTSKSSLRIDWFDGTVIEQPVSNNTRQELYEDKQADKADEKPQYSEKKLMGFKRLLDLSQKDAPTVTLELSGRTSFWDLLNSELKDDFIVLIVKIIAKLYHHLMSGQKSLMLQKLLKTKFLPSKFLAVLSDYMLNLPSIRISEKRMNMQFWDDAEAFYNSVLVICEGVYQQSPDEFAKFAPEFLEVIRTSIMGLIEEHTERFSEELFLKMDNLEVLLSNIVSEVSPNKKESDYPKKSGHKDNYKHLNIFPLKEDLLGCSSVKICPNIVNGAYSSVDHYLDIQFKLLREDCFAPLREGIYKYMENPSKKRHENIRVHPKVRIIRTYVTNNRVGHIVDIAWQERIAGNNIDGKRYTYNKQLMFGSLLLLTSDNFETVLCATVLDSNLKLLSEGYVAIHFCSQVSNKIFSEQYLMVESEVFFEPYHRVLKVLQSSDPNDIPMMRYIVDLQQEIKPPSYLTANTKYNIVNSNKEEYSFSVLDPHDWPTEVDLNLDHSQLEAFKLALTSEFAVIQGPPGTGKTFIGIKLATMILQNMSLEGTPMLVICYTNHALDQFLEGILNVTNNVIRLGNQSKNPKLAPYSLNNLRMNMKFRYSRLYGSKRAEQEKVYKQMMTLQGEIEKCEKSILTYNTVKPFLKIGDKNIELKQSKEDPILVWLFEHLADVLETDSDEEVEDNWENQLEDFDEKIDIGKQELPTCFSEQWALTEMDSILNSIKFVKDVTDDEYESKMMADKFQMQINKIRKRLNYFKKTIRDLQDDKIRSLKTTNIDPKLLTVEDRWNIYFNAVKCVKDMLLKDMSVLQDQHQVCTQELEETATLVDAEVVKTARVVGVTTTTAARRHDLLQSLKSPIVIIEEAAEVLEAHIVASLTHYCQHVILIGDHKQLRPTAAHYKLAKDYNLDVSLFERMIRNGIHARTLTTQRRMRPEFSGLLVPTVYERLDNHPVVLNYPNVRGCVDNLLFFDHDVFEDGSNEDSWSHKNTFEAKWCVSLANYIREQNYKAEEITILSTYTGQANLIREMSKNYKSLRDVTITVVDNYQGEENRIVILSLVRSNRDGRIGFLSAQNRICVALSRAKEGFFIFGNMGVLRSSSRIWSQISDKLTKMDAIRRYVTLRCTTHLENTLEVHTPEDLDNCLKGKCLKMCGLKR